LTDKIVYVIKAAIYMSQKKGGEAG